MHPPWFLICGFVQGPQALRIGERAAIPSTVHGLSLGAQAKNKAANRFFVTPRKMRHKVTRHVAIPMFGRTNLNPGEYGICGIWKSKEVHLMV